MLFRSEQPQSWLKALKGITLFDQLSERELRIVEDLVYDRTFEEGEIIFDQGEEGLGLYVIVAGAVAITQTENGTSKPIATLGPGHFFGELALLDGAPRTARARAVQPTELLGFFRPELLKLLKTHHCIASKICFALACHLGLRLRGLLERAQTEIREAEKANDSEYQL